MTWDERILNHEDIKSIDIDIIELRSIICDWIYRNRSKSHIGSYEIIDLKDFETL